MKNIRIRQRQAAFNNYINNPNLAIFLTLAVGLSLHLGVAFIIFYILSKVFYTKFSIIPASIRNFDKAFRRSFSGILCITIMMYCTIVISLAVYHGNSMGDVEIVLKMFLCSYFIFNYVRDHSVRTISLGAAAGAILACLVAGYEIAFLDQARADGPTNAIRFGMLAILFSGISLMALLFLQKPRWVFILLGLGAFAGLVAGFWSGSRGAIFTIPFMLLLLLPPLWRRQRTKEISLFGLYAAVALALFLFDSGGSKVRSENFVSGLLEDSKDQSVSVRKTLLFMSLGMFREHPLLGVGNSGWDREISRAMQPNETGSILQQSYNQAHNQYLNDFAKGGIVRGVAGISLLAVPAFLFLRSKPFAGDGNSLAALAGLITCLCYALFCLTESVMSLSLTATIYTLLVCYLIAATKQLEAESPESTHLLMSTWLVDVERQLAAQATEPPSSR